MFGSGSKQHKAAIKRFGKGGGPKAQVVTPKSSKGTKGAGKGAVGKSKSSGKSKGGGGGGKQPRDLFGKWT
jgi:hypothetical protein